MVSIGTIFAEYSSGSRREFTGTISRWLVPAAAVITILYQLYIIGIAHTYDIQHQALLHLFSLLPLAFLFYSYSEKRQTHVPPVDVFLALVSLAVGAYFYYESPGRLVLTGSPTAIVQQVSNVDFVFGIVLLLLILEGCRRTLDIWYSLLIVAFLAVTFFGNLLPGKWWFESFSLRKLIDLTVWSHSSGLWGDPIRTSATVILAFLAFGNMMQYSGIGDLVLGICRVFTAGKKGGPALATVVGSGLLGSVTAGPSANIALAGTFTIPMMKRIGYSPAYAGGIEAAASTGSSIVPPVMTGIAFLIVALAGIPYAAVMAAALMPAFLYYWGIIWQVYFHAAKNNIGAGDKPVPFREFWTILRERGHIFIPIILLVVLILQGTPPVIAALWSTISVPVIAAFRKNTRMGPQKIFKALVHTSTNMVMLALMLALSGTIMVVLYNTGLAQMFAHTISSIASGSIFLLLVVSAAVSLIVGLAAPPIACYLILVLIVVSPMLQSGLAMITAHMFALYYANIAMITPPIANAAAIAASIAGASMWPISIIASRLAVAGFVVPFIFAYRQGLLMIGSPVDIILAFIIGSIVILALAAALEGFLLKPLNIIERLLLISAGCALIAPNSVLNILAAAVIALIVLWQARQRIKVPR